MSLSNDLLNSPRKIIAMDKWNSLILYIKVRLEVWKKSNFSARLLN